MKNKDNCLLCKGKAVVLALNGKHSYKCLNCGEYSVTQNTYGETIPPKSVAEHLSKMDEAQKKEVKEEIRKLNKNGEHPTYSLINGALSKRRK